jgi:membrane-associated phospholipid phosphatase
MIAGSTARAIWQRIKARWQHKAWLTALLAFVFVPLYLVVSHRVWRPLWSPPLTWLDRHIAFQPGWVWPYQSLYLITATIPWLATTRLQLRRYVISFWLVATIGLVTFVLLPVAAPRPPVAAPSSGMSILLSYDGPYGDFPSLHAGFLVLTLAFGFRVMECRVPIVVIAAMLAWAMVILFATLALKEHYAIDLLAGIVLALVADWLVWHGRWRLSARMPRKIGLMSQRGRR